MLHRITWFFLVQTSSTQSEIMFAITEGISLLQKQGSKKKKKKVTSHSCSHKQSRHPSLTLWLMEAPWSTHRARISHYLLSTAVWTYSKNICKVTYDSFQFQLNFASSLTGLLEPNSPQDLTIWFTSNSYLFLIKRPQIRCVCFSTQCLEKVKHSIKDIEQEAATQYLVNLEEGTDSSTFSRAQEE